MVVSQCSKLGSDLTRGGANRVKIVFFSSAGGQAMSHTEVIDRLPGISD
jgi:hypothetical protein